MKRAALALLCGLIISTSSGCCLIDRIVHCWRYGLPPGGCYPGGACSSCGGGCPYGNCTRGPQASPVYRQDYGDGQPDCMCQECMASEQYGGSVGNGPMGGGGGGGAYVAGPCVGRHRPTGQMASQGGPATGAVTYPYYTTRGPRDFLTRNPAPIGP